jgi:hypothetical protein
VRGIDAGAIIEVQFWKLFTSQMIALVAESYRTTRLNIVAILPANHLSSSVETVGAGNDTSKLILHFDGLKTLGGMINSTGPTTPAVVGKVTEEDPWGVMLLYRILEWLLIFAL